MLSIKSSENSEGLQTACPDACSLQHLMQSRLWEALVPHIHCLQMLTSSWLTQFQRIIMFLAIHETDKVKGSLLPPEEWNYRARPSQHRYPHPALPAYQDSLLRMLSSQQPCNASISAPGDLTRWTPCLKPPPQTCTRIRCTISSSFLNVFATFCSLDYSPDSVLHSKKDLNFSF